MKLSQKYPSKITLYAIFIAALIFYGHNSCLAGPKYKYKNKFVRPYKYHKTISLSDLNSHARDNFEKHYPRTSRPGKIEVGGYNYMLLVKGKINGEPTRTLILASALDCEGYGMSLFNKIDKNKYDFGYLYLFEVQDGNYQDLNNNELIEVRSEQRNKYIRHFYFGLRVSETEAKLYHYRDKSKSYTIAYPSTPQHTNGE